MKNHTFVICAYKESTYLEECIKSIVNQTIRSKIMICTSTPNSYIQTLAQKYNLEYVINSSKPYIANDWNFAYSQAKTKYVTLVHQDDIYDNTYLQHALEFLNNRKSALIYFCQYYEIKNSIKVYNNLNLKIKKMLLFPLKVRIFAGNVFVKRRVLAFGNPICCPSVTYVKDSLPEKLFKQGFKSNIDWEAWEMLSRKRGEFVYDSKPLMGHRVHEESTTTEIINSNLRTKEDLQMLKKFWPHKIAKIINKFYSKSEISNKQRV